MIFSTIIAPNDLFLVLTWKLRIWGFQNWPYFNIWKLPNQSFEPLKNIQDFLKTPCINKQSFWAILFSNLLSHFLAYLRQFKSKSHIQGHPQKEENKSFHLTPILMVFQALLLEIWALKKSLTNPVFKGLIQFHCTCRRHLNVYIRVTALSGGI